MCRYGSVPGRKFEDVAQRGLCLTLLSFSPCVLAAQLADEFLRCPRLPERPPEEFLLTLGRQTADRRVLVQIGRERIALGTGCDHRIGLRPGHLLRGEILLQERIDGLAHPRTI